jgi:sulfur relay (sulfurtransferase) DsrF/TusC family protein
MSATHQNGVLFVATGAYALAAHEAAASIRKHSPDLGIQLFTDCLDIPDGIYDHIAPITNPHMRSKVDFISQSRFERTLYLDTDIRIVEDISEMFSLLDRFDIAVAHAHLRNHSSTSQLWRCEIPDSFPQMNGGIILFRNSPQVMQLLGDWSTAYKEAGFKKDQVTLRELLWLSDLRIATLPPEYNIRYPKYLKVWKQHEARPRILHYARFHTDLGLALPPSGNRWKLRLERACSLFATKRN